jgi:hypothetical protein
VAVTEAVVADSLAQARAAAVVARSAVVAQPVAAVALRLVVAATAVAAALVVIAKSEIIGSQKGRRGENPLRPFYFSVIGSPLLSMR